MLSYRRFVQIRFDERASALTYYSILSIVPVAAVAFGIAKGFGVQERLFENLINAFPAQQEIILNVIDFAQNLLETTSGGLIAGLGLALLVWSVLNVMGNIEDSMNEVWEVEDSRTWIRKFTDYFSMLLLAPFGFILIATINVFIQTQLELFFSLIGIYGAMAVFIDFLLGLIPVLLIALLFSLFYLVMPNTEVRFKSAFYAGVVAGVAFQMVQIVYIGFQVGVSRANAIYGSFAALPLFLIWLQISWKVIVAGGVLSFVHQNLKTMSLAQRQKVYSEKEKLARALWILSIVVQHFNDEQQPPGIEELGKRTHLSVLNLRELLTDLESAGLITLVKQHGKMESKVYLPAFDTHRMTIQRALVALLSAPVKNHDHNTSTSEEDLTPFDEIVNSYMRGESTIECDGSSARNPDKLLVDEVPNRY